MEVPIIIYFFVNIKNSMSVIGLDHDVNGLIKI
ncbi:MAG: hypothetical protein TECD_00919 [Hyphomicrobiaceae bacterium hypho_1]